jgi:hypothetical protein
MEAMWSRNDPFIANVLVWGCILLSGGVALGPTALGMLYVRRAECQEDD